LGKLSWRCIMRIKKGIWKSSMKPGCVLRMAERPLDRKKNARHDKTGNLSENSRGNKKKCCVRRSHDLAKGGKEGHTTWETGHH